MDAEEVSYSSDEPKRSIQSETHSGFAAMYRIGGDVGSAFHILSVTWEN